MQNTSHWLKRVRPEAKKNNNVHKHIKASGDGHYIELLEPSEWAGSEFQHPSGWDQGVDVPRKDKEVAI